MLPNLVRLLPRCIKCTSFKPEIRYICCTNMSGYSFLRARSSALPMKRGFMAPNLLSAAVYVYPPPAVVAHLHNVCYLIWSEVFVWSCSFSLSFLFSTFFVPSFFFFAPTFNQSRVDTVKVCNKCYFPAHPTPTSFYKQSSVQAA